MIWKAWQVQGWVETPCRIEKAKLESHDSDGTTYKATAEYSYRYGGTGYRSTQVGAVGGADNIGSFQIDADRELQKHLKSGQPFRCFVNPEHPNQAVLFTDPRLLMPAFLLVFALSFPAAGVFIMTTGYLGGKEVKRTQLLRAAYPGEPWRWKPIWSGPVIPQDGQVATNALIAYAVWSGLLIIPFSLLALKSGILGKPSWLWLILIYPLIWLLIAKAVFRSLRARMAFGKIGFEPAMWPGTPGGGLRGAIVFSRALPPQGEVKATLLCERQITKESGDGKTTAKETLWSHEATVPVMMASQSPTGSRVQVGFAIPHDAPETELDDLETKHVWKLRVKVPGSPVDATLEVPVMKHGQSGGARMMAEVAVSGSTSYLDDADRDLSSRLAGSGIEARFSPDGMPVSIVCPPCRPKSMLVFLVLFDVLWTAAFVFMWIKRAPLIFIGVWGVSSMAIWASIVWMILHRRTVSFDGRGLVIVRELGPFRKWEERLQKPEISGFADDSNMSSGTAIYGRVKAKLRNGKTSTIADSIEGSVVTQALVKRLEKWLDDQG